MVDFVGFRLISEASVSIATLALQTRQTRVRMASKVQRQLYYKVVEFVPRQLWRVLEGSGTGTPSAGVKIVNVHEVPTNLHFVRVCAFMVKRSTRF